MFNASYKLNFTTGGGAFCPMLKDFAFFLPEKVAIVYMMLHLVSSTEVSLIP